MKTNIGIIFGGRSGEHEISVRSATAVIQNIDQEKYSVVPIAISADGKWLSPAESLGLLPDGSRSAVPDDIASITKPVAPVIKGLATLNSAVGMSSTQLDVVFPVLHGTF